MYATNRVMIIWCLHISSYTHNTHKPHLLDLDHEQPRHTLLMLLMPHVVTTMTGTIHIARLVRVLPIICGRSSCRCRLVAAGDDVDLHHPPLEERLLHLTLE